MLVTDDNGTGTDKCSDKDIALAAWTAVRDAVDFVKTRAFLTGGLDCTACCNIAHKYLTNAAVTCEIELFQNYFSTSRR